ncbi:MAG: hypothetical protein CME70_03340 [Halobacteriovorax sp.]|nr:hypothetical protein [Halobacteriovorax sp.]MBK23018.1 hypothetical protein [Halobacteriovorax sp.]|tara:strand:- start:55256 stop:55663 length:408 start_codon:yes stop_codon:yes gene_type:complete
MSTDKFLEEKHFQILGHLAVTDFINGEKKWIFENGITVDVYEKGKVSKCCGVSDDYYAVYFGILDLGFSIVISMNEDRNYMNLYMPSEDHGSGIKLDPVIPDKIVNLLHPLLEKILSENYEQLGFVLSESGAEKG